MTHSFVFNGDADGLCALQQLRLAEPRAECQQPSLLITGVKRDIALLDRVSGAAGDRCTVLDVSLDVNRAALQSLLDAGVSVRYFDHHFAGEVPAHAKLEAYIDLGPNVCTSLLVDRYLGGRFRTWAIAGIFGDSLVDEGRALAGEVGLPDAATERLRELGVAINYNAYGETVADLHVPPAQLAGEMLPFADPLEFAEISASFARLRDGFRQDMDLAQRIQPSRKTPGAIVFLLPDLAWARRVSGTLANDLAKAHADSAIAIVSPKTGAGGGYLVSVRVPRACTISAEAFCRRFPTGGGRCSAAGINHLPGADLETFATAFEQTFRVG
ncbi:MAG TPA: acetyltransferase [Polyangia bacterium]|jgi:hypothetical protein|nr:acetyltransferase [Polyangia bacterium]